MASAVIDASLKSAETKITKEKNQMDCPSFEGFCDQLHCEFMKSNNTLTKLVQNINCSFVFKKQMFSFGLIQPIK